MSVRYYLDTSIWLDYYFKRGKNGELALQLLSNIILNNFTVVFSNYVEKELKSVGLSQTEINALIKVVKPKHIKKVYTNPKENKKARKIAKSKHVPLGDVIHAIIAKNHDAILVSHDKDFEKLKDIVCTKKPEEIISIST